MGMVAGEIVPFKLMAEKLASVPDGVEWLDAIRASGGNPRLPVVMRDGASRWWWLGLRSAFFLNGGERVSYKGSTRTAERREMNFTDGSSRMLWVIDELPALSPGGYVAPYPLETKEHARKYDQEGINGLLTAQQMAARLGWKGGDAIATTKKFRDYLFAAMGGNVKLMEMRRKELGNVRFPGAVEVVEKRMNWHELSGLIVKQGEDLAAMREEIAAVGKRVDLLTRRLDTADKIAGEAKRRVAAEVETLRAEVARLADFVI